MNKYALQAIHKRLIEIKNKVNIDKNKGICFNLSRYTYKRKKSKSTFIGDCSWLDVQFDIWDECHKNNLVINMIGYPVGGRDEFFNKERNGTLWENPKRLELLDFLIEQSANQLKKLIKSEIKINEELLQAIIKRLEEIKKWYHVNFDDDVPGNVIWRTISAEVHTSIAHYALLAEKPITIWLYEQFQTWHECHIKKYYTKDIRYPIGGHDEYEFMFKQGTVWKNPKRLRLVDYLIKQAKTQLHELKA